MLRKILWRILTIQIIVITLGFLSGAAFIHAQQGFGLPVWYLSPDAAVGIQRVDWTQPEPQINIIPGSGPTFTAPCFPAVNACGETVFIVTHSGIRNSPTDIFIYDPDWKPLLNDNTPTGPGLNGKKAGYETQVIKVPGKSNEWYIFYPEWKTDNGAPLGNGAYTPAPILYSRVKYSCKIMEVIERDVVLKVNGVSYTYTNGIAIARMPESDELCLYITRRNSGNSYLSVDRFLINSNGIIFNKNSGNLSTSYWNLTAESSFIEVSNDGKRLLVLNRNQDTDWTDMFLFDATIFSNMPGAYQAISTGELMLQPDNQVLFSAGAVKSLAYSNSNLYFLRNLERKIAEAEFSPDGRFLYFVCGGFAEAYHTNLTYLGQIYLGTYDNPASYPYPLRLQIQTTPNGVYDPVTGRGGLESVFPGSLREVLYIEKSFDGNMYFIKRERNYLFSIPNPNNEMVQSLIPSDIDLSTPDHPNIPYVGTLRSVPDQIDGYNYITSINPVIFLGNDTIICEGQEIILTPGSQFESYCWQDGSQDPVYITDQPGTYWLEVIDEFGCFAYDTIKIQTIGEAINLGPDITLCQGDSVFITPGDGFESYLWQDGSIAPGMLVKTDGLYWVEVVNTGGCTAIDSVYVYFSPLPTIDLGPDAVIYPGETLILDAGPGFVSYQWQDGSTGRIFEVTGEGIYWVSVSDGICEAADTIRVILNDCEAKLFIPNCFTPNSDGYNDVFNVVSENLSSFHMLIFNRWGQMIFETMDVNQGWDGKLNGQLCPQGTYFYLIRYTTPCSGSIGQSGERKGSVTLLM